MDRIKLTGLCKLGIMVLMSSGLLIGCFLQYHVYEIRFLAPGGDMHWAPDGTDRIVFDRVDESGISQVHMIRPDGSGERCLTDPPVEGGPALEAHKGHPFWHPSGQYLVMQVEMEDHYGLPETRWVARPGAGWWCNLWVTTPDGEEWFQLTDYSSTWQVEGCLFPRFSHDGSKLFWSKLVSGTEESDDWFDKGDDFLNPFGNWELRIADFVVDEDGPHLENIEDITPNLFDRGAWFESHGFSHDDKKIIFTTDMGLEHTYGMDIWTLDLETRKLSNLTDTTADWEEHAHYSPDGEKISYMSTSPFQDFSVRDISSIRAEAFLMNPDGSGKQQLTHFSEPGFPEYTSERSVAACSSWSPDGSKLLLSQILAGPNYPKRQMWVVEFYQAPEPSTGGGLLPSWLKPWWWR